MYTTNSQNVSSDHVVGEDVSMQENPLMKPIIREKGLGLLAAIPDEGIIDGILVCFSMAELCHLSTVSKSFLVLTEDSRLWKQFTFNAFEGDFWYDISWKYTYVSTWASKDPKRKNTMTGFTNSLYSRWSSAQYDMNQFDLPFSHIERIPADSLTYEEFTERYNKYQRPVIITGALSNWKAMTNWKFDKFLEKYGDVEFKTDQHVSHLYPHYSELYSQYLQDKKEGLDLKRYDEARKGGNIKMKFKNYYNYMQKNKDEHPIYVFDSKFGDRDNRLLEEYEIPKLLSEDFFEQCLDTDERPLFRWMVIGPSRSGTSFHMDPYLSSAWNALISGRKRWLFYAMNNVSEDLEEAIAEMEFEEQQMIKERLTHDKEMKKRLLDEGKISKIYDDEFEVRDPTKPIPSYIPCSQPVEWLTNEYFTAIEQGRRPWECVQYPGDLIFVPSGKYHQ